ncbi:choloylglycine hydrolase [Vibrio sp. 10N.286.49.C2]|uniref:linear amide C-N hydrolase n=1 Tax=unclassified Vibrio TaxID=2614977 RepID=UPI000C81CE59|nr:MULTISPECIES: choloylglycine hydrolase family protein [unclassified Vibrio]PMH42954.1 choloylglycine hydrolase [Vibrio sp. 10N.286.49.C2]PMH53707.1 choloylglycine hydrolase [Vibrio sp. 10N.286.49.B1]PMH82450.1 choloylglycine hydrolase [Vibrio sp. 10N.286.48.B7]
MNILRKTASKVLSMTMLIPALHFGGALACTSIALQANDGSVVYGRTMEWGAFDLNSRVAIVPQGHEFQASTPEGRNGMKWKAKYGVVALDALEKDYLTDGMNEKGLIVGVLYLPGFAQFQEFDASQADKTVSELELANYLLTSFATIDEVKSGLKDIRVVGTPEPSIGGIAAPIHLTIIEPSGQAIVVEYLDGKLNIFDNPLRVMTNSPSFDWHMTNLRNYVGLTPIDHATKTLTKGEQDVNLAPIGAGSGFLGLPGDFTPPSRFVRATAYSQTARNLPNSEEALYEVLRIMDNFNLPLGAAEGPQADLEGLEGMRSSTIWTSVADSHNLKYYYHTQHNRQLRMIDLTKIDFTTDDKAIRHLPLDINKVQAIQDITPK